MSTQTEITRLTNAKASIKTAIENKGVEVPSSTTLDGYASLINQIPTGSSGVQDIIRDGQSIVDSEGVADLSGYALKEDILAEVEALEDINTTLEANFSQAVKGVKVDGVELAKDSDNKVNIITDSAPVLGSTKPIQSGAVKNVENRIDSEIANTNSNIEKLGNSIGMQGWNQLVKNGNFENTNFWIGGSGGSISVSNNEITATLPQSTGDTYLGIAQEVKLPIVGHKYYLHLYCYSDKTYLGMNFAGYNLSIAHDLSISDYNEISFIFTSTATNSALSIFSTNSTVFHAKNVNLYDLTEMFGKGNEPSTIEEFKALFPAEYYPFSDSKSLGTVPYRQLFKNGDFTSLNTWGVNLGTASISNHVVTITCTTNGSNVGIYKSSDKPTWKLNHKYFFAFDVQPSVNTTISFGFESAGYISKRLQSGVKIHCYGTRYCSDTSLAFVAYSPLSVGDTIKFSNFVCFDLTDIFGEGNEPSEEEANKLFPAQYYPFSQFGDLLWTNSSPTSSFSAQTLSLDLKGYLYLLVVCKETNSSSVFGSNIINVDGNLFRASLVDGSYYYNRDFTASGTGIVITTGRRNSSTGTSYMIPVEIYGIK